MTNETPATGHILTRMRRDQAPEIVIQTFLRHYHQLRAGARGLIPEAAIRPGPALPDLAGVQAYREQGNQALSRVVMLKLNGGLGTSMGLETAKSLIPVKNGLAFLDLIARQVLHLRRVTSQTIPLLLMNSRTTHDDSARALSAYPELSSGQGDLPLFFMQHRVPKLDQTTFEPVNSPEDPELEWCPPGHGDIYLALATSGLLRRLLDRGFRYAFISNSDNLGATLDPGILGYLAARKLPFLMEVTPRTEADRKGGHLAQDLQGRWLLRELAQCPNDELALFQDISRHPLFNTNNIWLNLEALDQLLDQPDAHLDLSLIINRKTVDPRNTDSRPVYQLETAMGSAISLFSDAQAIRVPRSRFSPVKTTADLLVLWSDVYDLTPEFHLTLHSARQERPPTVELDPEYYRMFDQFLTRFPAGAPSLVDCQSLALDGDIRFGAGVKCVGRVRLRNRAPGPVTIDRRTFGPAEAAIDLTPGRP